MKIFLLTASVSLLMLAAASCSNETENEVMNETLAPVTVHASGFTVEQEDFPGTRATPVADVSSVQVLTLAFFKVSDGSEVYKHTQIRTSLADGETFGEFSCYLPIGNYKMVVIANGGANGITLTSPTSATWGENNINYTFVNTQSVDIANNNPVNLNATLDRIVSAVAVQSTDARPAGVTHMRFTFSAGGKSFNPTSGLATSNTGFVTTMAFTGAAGNTTKSAALLFLATNEQNIDVTFETLDAADGNVLFSKTITGVPLMRNRITWLTGAIYSGISVSANSFQVNTSWIADYNIDF